MRSGFQRTGPTDLSMAELAKVLNIGPGTVYFKLGALLSVWKSITVFFSAPFTYFSSGAPATDQFDKPSSELRC